MLCDQNLVNAQCDACDTCEVSKTWGDFPVHTVKQFGWLEYYCVVYDSRCDWYYDKNLKKSIRQNGKGLTGALPSKSTNVKKPIQQTNQTQNTNKATNKNNATTTNTTNKTANTSNSKNNANTNNASNTNTNKNTNTNSNVNSNNSSIAANTETAKTGTPAGIVSTPNTLNDGTVADNTNVDNKNVDENSNSNNNNNISDTTNQVNPNDAKTNNIIDGNVQKEIGNDNGVSPYVIGSLSFFSILLFVVGFLYVKKRKNDRESEIDPIYRNSSVFFATPIVEKRGSQTSQRSQKSNISKYSAHNRTVISSNDDGDFDIVISPTNAGIAAVSTNDDLAVSQSAQGPIQAYAETSAFESNNSSGINVSSTENFISKSNVNGITGNSTSMISPSLYSQTSAMEASNIIVPTTMPGGANSKDVISPLVPASSNQNIIVQNASFSYDINDMSTHDPSISFINSTNGISFIKSKDESCILSPIMDKSESNIFIADMATENSINVDLKQLTSTPKLHNSNGKKTLSMVISEYKEDVIYNAKYNYDPSMEDEMKIRINDRVLVKEILFYIYLYILNI